MLLLVADIEDGKRDRQMEREREGGGGDIIYHGRRVYTVASSHNLSKFDKQSMFTTLI